MRNKLQWSVNRNSYIFIQENAFEIVVCEIAVILPRPLYVNITDSQRWKWRIDKYLQKTLL